MRLPLPTYWGNWNEYQVTTIHTGEDGEDAKLITVSYDRAYTTSRASSDASSKLATTLTVQPAQIKSKVRGR